LNGTFKPAWYHGLSQALHVVAQVGRPCSAANALSLAATGLATSEMCELEAMRKGLDVMALATSEMRT